jgi:hypothetical protein
MYFYRTVSRLKTRNGTPYTEVFWWRGSWDVIIQGVIFRHLSGEEYAFFMREF